MRTAIIVFCVFIGAVVMAADNDHDMEIPPRVVEQIQELLAGQVITYRLDGKKNRKVFERIEKWVKSRMDLDRKRMTKDEQGEWVCFRELRRANTPILLDAGGIRGVEPLPFNVFYVEEPLRRTFRKEIWEPTGVLLTCDEVEEMGARFIRDHKFVETTDLDRMSGYHVLAWKTRAIEGDGKAADPMTVLQRATFNRTFQDWEVVNSRQIVDMHPATRELIAYKSLEWTPIDEHSGKLESATTTDQVIREIQKAFANEPDVEIIEVRRAWTQTRELLIPILVIRKKYDRKADSALTPHDTIYISMVDKVPLESDPTTADQPGKATPSVQ